MTQPRIIALIIALLFSATAAHAQTYVFGRANFPVGKEPNSLVLGDFNGDGINDIAIVNSADNTVSILLGKSDGTFSSQVTYATGTAPVAIATGDFDGDGNLDLAVTNGGCLLLEGNANCGDGHTISIFLGNGDGTFQDQVDYTTGTYPTSLAVADLNADGILDLAIANVNDGTVSILLGIGDGTFQAQVVYPAVLNVQSLIVADFNGDNKPDLAVAASGDSTGVAILLGNGDGTFQKPLDFQGQAPLAAADFNLDGKMDLFAGGGVYLGNGDGTFVLHATYPGEAAVAAADVNGDGKPDLVVGGGSYAVGGGPYSDTVGIMLGNGDGTFQSAVQYLTGLQPIYLAIADVNGDGKLDVVVADSGCGIYPCTSGTITPGTVSVLLGFGDGTFVGTSDYAFPFSNPPNVVSADFNGDGKPDLAAVASFSVGASSLGVYLGNGDGTFQPVISTALTQSLGWLVAADFNGDGKADLASVLTSNCSDSSTCLPGNAVIFIGNGDGTFQKQSQVVIPGQDSLSGITTGDFSGDGKLDLAVTDVTANQAMIFLGNGDGTFQAPIASASANSGYPTVADFNGDGKPDLIIGGEFTSLSVILFGNGDGTFQPPLFAFPGSGPPAVADFSEDGSPDVAGGPGEGAGNAFPVVVMLSTAFKALSPTSLNFGYQGVGITSAAQAITLSNPSNVLLNIASITATANFSQTNNCGATLAPGENCTITVKFAPISAEAVSGAITITDNTKISPLAIAVTGIGVNGPFLTAEPNQEGFAGQAVGTKSTAKSILLVNTGNAPLTISGLA